MPVFVELYNYIMKNMLGQGPLVCSLPIGIPYMCAQQLTVFAVLAVNIPNICLNHVLLIVLTMDHTLSLTHSYSRVCENLDAVPNTFLSSCVLTVLIFLSFIMQMVPNGL